MLYLFFVFAYYTKKANEVNVLCSPLLICLLYSIKSYQLACGFVMVRLY